MKYSLNAIKYLRGDATKPINKDGKNIIIAHICNDIGKWGKGFVLALSKKWEEPEKYYRLKFKKSKLVLGDVDYNLVEIKKEYNIFVANMIAQHNVQSTSRNKIPIRYNALAKCLTKLNEIALSEKASIHMPRIGAGLAGGNWKFIERLIRECTSVNVYIYDLI